jgi:heavy metal sensor kinase
MRFGPIKTVLHSLRFRLMAAYTAAMLVMLMATLIGVREGLRYTLRREFDQLLLEDSQEICLEVRQTDRQNLTSDLDRKAVGHAHHHWFVQLLTHQGEIIWSSRNTPELDLPLPSGSQTTFLDADPYRLAQCRLDQAGDPPWIVRVGSSRESLDADVALLTKMMLLGGGIGCVLAPLGGYWLAGRATRPLARIIHTTARLRPSQLDERLPLRGSGDELDQLSRTINGFLDRIAAYLQQKRDFVANAAHELRSPLAAIQSTVEVALNNDRSREEYVELLHEVVERCGDLGVLVNQLLLLAESHSDHLAFAGKPVALGRIVEKSLAMFEGAAEVQGVSLRSGPLGDILVFGDENHLRQVINNLLDNAIKFTRPGGQVQVELAAVGDRAMVRVSDTGVGIPPEDLPHVFERFYRGDKSRQRELQRGNGLGLSICHSIVTAHGGDLSVASTVDRGSHFTVQLPIWMGSSADNSPLPGMRGLQEAGRHTE